MKIIEKINAIHQSEKDRDKTFYSFEYFPPRTEQGKGHAEFLLYVIAASEKEPNEFLF
jgi:hypothetical protein